ncbi:Putative oxidoreductase CatD [Chlamydiales bacterium SCGC AB-751-O23]|nr:Putative oxidoreductase CatD [Chlamydiales bacterium SCGC AB-751-O23]
MLARLGDWLPRIALAAIFFTHGIEKFLNVSSFANSFKLPLVVAYLVASAELLGSVLIIAGAMQNDFFTRLGGLSFSIVMLGAVCMVHWPDWNEMQFPVLILAISTTYFLKGNRS